MSDNEKIQKLIAEEHRLEQQLAGLVYGAPEIRDGKYIYVHYRDGGRLLTRYVGEYSDELHNLIIRNGEKAKQVKRELKSVRHDLRALGYSRRDLDNKVRRNLDFAKRNLALTVHSQAILEGVATTFADTEAIIEGARISGMTEKDVRKIVNMKHAWEFIMDEDVVTATNNLVLLCQINKLVEEGFYFGAGQLRDVPVNIGGTRWQPELPIESRVVEGLNEILNAKVANGQKAINLLLFVMKSQLFIDGNKRTAVIFANHFLIQKGVGLIYVPEDLTDEFKRLLVRYYETGRRQEIVQFLEKECLVRI